MKWPGTADKPNKPDLSSLSDDQLDDLMVAAGSMDQDELDRQRDSHLMIALANLPGGPPDYCETLRGLMRLRDEGPFPFEAQDLYEKLRARAVADVEAAHKAAPKVAPSPPDIPADMSLTGWLKARWASADTTVRHSLRAIANSIGIDVPFTRTRPVGDKDSSPARRTESEPQPSQAEARRKDIPAEKEEPEERDYHAPPEWDDDHADGWTPCDSLYDALHPDDRGWY